MKQPPSFPDRRQFLKTGGTLAAGLLSHEGQAATKQRPTLPATPRTQASMPTRNLGKTGYKVGIFSLGGQSAIEQPNNFESPYPLSSEPSISASTSSTPPPDTDSPSGGASGT